VGRLVPTVLVADDDDDVREAVADVVLRAGYDVALARHGFETDDVSCVVRDVACTPRTLLDAAHISKTPTLIMPVMGLVEVPRRRGSGVR
jgi:CheY-like chemotaxis protein